MAAGKTRKKINTQGARSSGGGGGGDMQKIYYDPLGFETSVLFTVQEITVETAQLSLSSPGTFQFTLEGQKVKIESGTTTLPTGIGHIITTVTLSDALVYGYSQVAQAYVTALGVYVPCTYDVVTNAISGTITVWAGDISQTGTSDPTVDRTHLNLFATPPTFAYVGDGIYWFISPISFFSMENYIPTSRILDISGPAVTTSYTGATKINIFSGVINDSYYNDILNVTYITISVNLSDLI